MRRPIPLFAWLLIILFALAAALLPNRTERDQFLEETLALAGKLPLPAWLESKRIAWSDRVYRHKIEALNPPRDQAAASSGP